MQSHDTGRHLALPLMSLLYLLLMASTFNALGIVLPAMVKDLSMNWAQAGFGFTLLGLACGLTSLVPAASIRRLGVARTLLFGTSLLAIGFECMAMGKTVGAYYVGTTLVGVGYSFCGSVTGVHVISKLFERRSPAIGLYFTIGNLGAVLGPLLFLYFVGLAENWRLFWMICGLSAIATGGMAAFVTRDGAGRRGPATADQNGAEIGGWRADRAIRTPQFWIVVAAYTACLLINTTVHSFVVQHLAEQGIVLTQSAGLLSAVALAGAIISGLAGVIGERVSARTLTLFALGMLTMACVALILPAFPLRLGIFVVCMGLGFGASYVGTALLLLDYFGRGSNLELFATMCTVSTSAALGPALGGVMRDHSGDFFGVFAAHAAIGAIVFVALACSGRPHHDPVDDASGGVIFTSARVGEGRS